MNRLKLITAAAISVALVSSLTACLPAPRPAPERPAATEEAPAPEPEPIPEPAGTYENPAPAGSAVVITDWDGAEYEVTIAVTEWDANATVASVNRFNEPSTTGQYALATVTITNVGTSIPVSPLTVAWSVKLLGADGIARDGASVVTPTESYNIGDIYPGATGSFTAAYEVPVGSTSGVWVFDASTPYYLTA